MLIKIYKVSLTLKKYISRWEMLGVGVTIVRIFFKISKKIQVKQI